MASGGSDAAVMHRSRLGGGGPRDVPALAAVDTERPDPTREQCEWYRWAPGKQVLRAIRRYQRSKSRGAWGRLLSKTWVAHHRFWSAVAGCEIPLNARLGEGLHLPHPQGVVIHPDAEVGPNCMLMQQVTLGTGPRPGVPQLGTHVDVGPGAKILGGVQVGTRAVVGANAVVIDDVPAGAIAVGVPARVLPERSPRTASHEH